MLFDVVTAVCDAVWVSEEDSGFGDAISASALVGCCVTVASIVKELGASVGCDRPDCVPAVSDFVVCTVRDPWDGDCPEVGVWSVEALGSVWVSSVVECIVSNPS